MEFYSLTITRFIAALCIVIYHGICLKQDVFPFNNVYLNKFFMHGNSAVIYFYLLSGFIMAVNNDVENVNKKKYWIDRFSRIYPVYFLGILIVIFFPMFGKIIDYLTYHNITFSQAAFLGFKDIVAFIQLNTKGLFLNLFLIQSWFSDFRYAISAPNWSLSTEIFFYFLFPFIFPIIKNFSKNTFLYGVIVVWLLISLFFGYFGDDKFKNTDIQQIINMPIAYIHIFLLGLTVGWWIKKSTFEERVKMRNFTLLISFLFTLNYVFFDGFNSFHHTLMYQSVLFLWLILLVVSIKSEKVKSFLTRTEFLVLGDISYSLYILHLPISIYVSLVFSSLKYSPTQVFYISTIISLASSYICLKFYEFPMRNLLKNHLYRYFHIQNK
jgi:peptidoglycan/LPS O-acetylase OafA/YrhL